MPRLYSAVQYVAHLGCATHAWALDKLTIRQEEEDVIAGAQDDAEILLSMDAILSDDGLIETMWEALKQYSKPSGQEAVAFVLKLIHRRTGIVIDGAPLQSITSSLDLGALSKRAYIALMNILAEAIMDAGSLTKAGPEWLLDAIVLLLHKSPHAPSSDALAALRMVVGDDASPAIEAGTALGRRLKGGQDDEKYHPMSDLLIPVYGTNGARQYVAAVSAMYNALLGSDSLTTFVSLRDHPELFREERTRPILEDLLDYFLYVVDWHVKNTPQGQVSTGVIEGSLILLELGGPFDRGDRVARVAINWWSVHGPSITILLDFAATSVHRRVTEARVSPALCDIMSVVDAKGTSDLYAIEWMQTLLTQLQISLQCYGIPAL